MSVKQVLRWWLTGHRHVFKNRDGWVCVECGFREVRRGHAA